MKKNLLFVCYLFMMLFFFEARSQKECSQWYFGLHAGLDFLTSPPASLSNSSAINVQEGSAAISDTAGNLLFYTDGATVWNKQHQVMANGSLLNAGSSSGDAQAAVIIKSPANAYEYYIFHHQLIVGPHISLQYSIVDMGLAAGIGSVTVKNVTLTTAGTTEELTATRHCNGIDSWILVHDWNSNNFRAFLLTANGVSLIPVVSAVGSILTNSVNSIGSYCMKLSPDGRKLASPVNNNSNFSTEVFDFDNATGVLSNSMSFQGVNGYGNEFSPDGSKLYIVSGYLVRQLDLCSGNAAQIYASLDTVAYNTSVIKYSIQNAIDGKLYIARPNKQSIGMINNPNALGSACNYSEIAMSVGTGTCQWGLPNFSTDFFRLKPSQFSYNISSSYCAAANFSVPPPISLLPGSSCSIPSYSVLSQHWNFGDASSGAANTSSLANPLHQFSSPGTYTVKLALNFNCHTDTLVQVVTFTNSAPSLSITGDIFLCESENTTLMGMGATSYSWNGVPGTNTLPVINPTTNTSFTLSGLLNGNLCVGEKTVMVTVSKCTSMKEISGANQIRFYPNPAFEKITIESDYTVSIRVYNSIGQFIFVAEVSGGKNELDISHISNGLYLMKIEDCETCKTERLIIHSH